MPFIPHSEIPGRVPMAGFHGRFLHTERVTIVYWDIEEGAVLPEHSHPHEQITHILSGRFEMTISGETRTFGPELVAVIPGNAVHSGRAITRCTALDVFQPVREDYKPK